MILPDTYKLSLCALVHDLSPGIFPCPGNFSLQNTVYLSERAKAMVAGSTEILAQAVTSHGTVC